MYSPLLNIVSQYAGAVLVGILVGLVCKVYFASQMQRKIKDYQGEIVKSHSKILELEAVNYRLEKKVKEVETHHTNQRMAMN
jgi:hypothetical protein